MANKDEVKVGIMQPYFMPYIGYFQLMKAVDRYVVFDDVNFIKRGWAARNNLLVNGQKNLFSLKLEGASQNKLFNEVFIGDDFVKLRKTIDMAYHKAPCYNTAMELLDRIMNYDDKRLSSFIFNSFAEILAYLDIDTELIMSSSIDKDNSLRGQDKILSICKTLGAREYYNAIGGVELYDFATFETNGIKLNFIKPDLLPYPQLRVSEFVPGLSIIDILMNCSVPEIHRLLDAYELQAR